ncbi:DUF6879 family protein [Streptomyces sp. CB02613]|uniref:DUF6879 family protein n=1 Tax=Streptomyces sp. CB02613 TaxID=2020328 RepID=UPI00081B3015|nr:MULTISPECIES: DUF6879 family protein [unclassified Streptomyces]SCE57420.1 hypothetical protein GA0115253_1075318 [Streptomyces sp. Termitarium-T10T-6]
MTQVPGDSPEPTKTLRDTRSVEWREQAQAAEQVSDWDTAISLVSAHAECYSIDSHAHGNHLWHMDLLARAERFDQLAELAVTDVHARRRLNRSLHEQGHQLRADRTSTGATRQARIIDLDEFEGLFRTFSHSAWRLETRRRYASDEATDTYRQFVETGRVEWDESDPYCELIRSRTTQGKRVERVRIVDQPPTTGQLYLLNNAKRNSGLGEDIRNLRRADADRLQLPAEDFWLFDSRLAARLRFDDGDHLVDVELITEPDEIVRYSVVRDAAWHHAVPHEAFAAKLSSGE